MSRIQTFDFSVDLLRAILWQYNDAARLQSLLQQKQDWYNVNQEEFWTNWYNDVFNLDTANEFGLSVWAIILDIPIVVELTPGAPKPTWGFEQYRKNFTWGNFAASSSGAQNLTPAQARLVLKLRYRQLISRGTIPEINKILADLFGDEGLVYVLDGLDMTMTVVFTYIPSADLKFVLENYDLIPRPAGVGVNYLVLVEETWGFENHENFDNGNFGINN